jgi:hypothetical protein
VANRGCLATPGATAHASTRCTAIASLGRKDGIFHVRFNLRGREYKNSLKVRDRSEAETATRIVEVTIHRLLTGQLAVPAGVVTARSRKQSRSRTFTARTIDLHPELRAVLQQWRDRPPAGQLVLADATTLTPLGPGRVNRLFWQPIRGTPRCLDGRRNWFKVGFHTYRHSFASNLAAAGADQRVIDEFMGHSTEQMGRRYRHLAPVARRSAIEAFALQPTRGGQSAEVTP